MSEPVPTDVGTYISQHIIIYHPRMEADRPRIEEEAWGNVRAKMGCLLVKLLDGESTYVLRQEKTREPVDGEFARGDTKLMLKCHYQRQERRP